MKKTDKSSKKSNQSKTKTKTSHSPKEGVKRSKLKTWASEQNKRRKDFLARRPHRSFQRTRRRDYNRSLKLPGYIALTAQVVKLLWGNKKTFFGLILIYVILTILSASIMSQDAYQQLTDMVNNASEEEGYSKVVPVLATFWGVFSSQATGVGFGEPGSSKQIIGVMFGLFTWLSAIWLTRAIMAGQKPRARDGIYSSGGPVVAMIILGIVLLIQMIPAAIALIGYSAASGSGLLNQTAVLMLFGGAAILLVTLSLYWVVSTLISMVIITLPGMYPIKALKLGGDLVVGRRMRILLRALWMLMVVFIAWIIVLVPIILIDSSLKSAIPDISWLPVVPAVSLFMTSLSIVFIALYVYVFYRKVVADEAPPA